MYGQKGKYEQSLRENKGDMWPGVLEKAMGARLLTWTKDASNEGEFC